MKQGGLFDRTVAYILSPFSLSLWASTAGYQILRFETADGTELKDEKAAPPRTVYVVGVSEK